MDTPTHFFDFSFLMLTFATLFVIFLMSYALKKKVKSQLDKFFVFVFFCLLVMCVGLIIQKFCVAFFNADPIYFEGFIYIGTCFLPVAMLFMTLSFVNTRIEFTKKYLLLLVIPAINVLALFTNSMHHLFYQKYSYVLGEMVLRSTRLSTPNLHLLIICNSYF